MIVGIGTDILEIRRIQKAYDRWGKRFCRKILSEFEQTRMKSSVNEARYLAKRFCAKEALSKALGTGMKFGVSFPQIEIRHTKKGAPIVIFLGNALKISTSKEVTSVNLSISDENEYVVAFAILSKD